MYRFRLAVPAVVFIAGVGVLAQTQQTQPPKASDKMTVGDDSTSTRKLSNMRQTTNAQRKAAAARTALGHKKVGPGGVQPRPALTSAQVPTLTLPNWSLLLSGLHANYANSPAIHKFTVTLPGLCAGNGANTLNANGTAACIPVANPDTLTYPGSDYYELEETQYTQLLHPDLSGPTLLRGYHQTNNGTSGATNTIAPPAGAHYLGPIIVAQTNKPVRLKVTNNLPHGGSAGDLFIPTDTTIMGAGMGPNGGNELYPQNRTAVHLHGGNTPWISDGTPHQWFTPAGETTSYLKGVSFRNVPDMIGTGKSILNPSDGDGMGTFYYTNQQSGRLMFYHDHAYGITRLNVYAGLASGYLLHDTYEDALIASGVLPNQSDLGALYKWGVPLIIQDKTFVPDSNTMNTTTGTLGTAPNQLVLGGADPTWAAGGWGGPDHGYGHNLWFPHVYMPNQNPADPEGVNPMGRWDYGPWFWPVQTSLTMGMPTTCTDNAAATCPNIPNPSLVPEAFMDTMLVNGAPYPNVTVQPKAYRFRILNASNDRTINLQLYYAVDPTKYVPAKFAATGTLATATAGVCNSSASTQANCTEVGTVDAVPHKTANPVQALNSYTNMLLCSTVTPVGGMGLSNALALNILSTPVPGTPGTGLPGACWPTTWPTDGRDGGVPDPLTAGPAIIQIGTEGGLLPEPVVIPSTPVGYNYNRRDIVVLNISNHGLTLGPAERADVVVDFSQVPAGSTLILYNDAPAPVPAFDSRIDYYTGDPEQRDTGGAATTLAGFGPNTRTVMQFRVAGTAAAQYSLANLQNPTTGLPNAYKLSQPAPLVQEAAYNPIYGTAYTDHFSRIGDTALHIDGTANTTAMQPKAIQELFTTDYGRMNATLGTELPLTSFLTQTTIPLGYVDPPTEIFSPGEMQIWKITHNGVDTHSMHFHLFNVQVINRVGWDGAVRAPDANEVGWKETVRMNPLEDAIVALKPTTQTGLPFPMSNSYRLLDPTSPVGSSSQFTGVDPLTNNPITVTNQMTDFGWEYVWHCHLLGHEENDMMRPMVLAVPVPGAPTSLQATAVAPTQVNLSWTYVNGTTPATGFYIFRKTGAGAFAQIATLTTTTVKAYSDVTVAPGTTYTYYVVAYTAGSPITLSVQSNYATVTTGLVTPENLAVSSISAGQVTITWSQANTGGVVGYYIQRATGNGPFTTIATISSATTTSYRNLGLTAGTRYSYRVQAYGAAGLTSAYSNVLSVVGR